MKQLTILLLSIVPGALAQTDRFGLPACQSENAEFASRVWFALCHDSAFRAPRWTAYEITPDRTGGSAKRPSGFRADLALALPAARNADYRGSGYAKGHMAPAEDFAFSEEAIRATFVLSNAAPQLPSVNLGPWRRIENAVRRVAAESDAAYVLTGPIFETEPTEWAGSVAVPTHFFKIVLAVRQDRKFMYAAIVPNAPASRVPITDFTVTVDEVERRTGLDFFPALDDAEERLLESRAVGLPSRLRRSSERE